MLQGLVPEWTLVPIPTCLHTMLIIQPNLLPHWHIYQHCTSRSCFMAPPMCTTGLLAGRPQRSPTHQCTHRHTLEQVRLLPMSLSYDLPMQGLERGRKSIDWEENGWNDHKMDQKKRKSMNICWRKRKYIKTWCFTAKDTVWMIWKLFASLHVSFIWQQSMLNCRLEFYLYSGVSPLVLFPPSQSLPSNILNKKKVTSLGIHTRRSTKVTKITGFGQLPNKTTYPALELITLTDCHVITKLV